VSTVIKALGTAIWVPMLLAGQAPERPSLVREVRAAIAQKDFARAETRVRDYRKQRGVTAEMVEALSWMGRGALAEKHLDQAEAYAQETHKLSLEQLKGRKLDDDKHLPLALGAAIEVEAQVMSARGERFAAVGFLNKELAAYRATSIRTRIQKNIHLLSLEGRPAPRLEGVTLPAGKPVLLFFWAHWCPNCKGMAPSLARLKQLYGGKGLVIVAPTQHYGYTRRGQDATPAEEDNYIGEVWREQYGGASGVSTPIGEENFRSYGASTTPTLVLVDSKGVVRMYHPGDMSYQELEPRVRQLF